jgi:hypothetical protein
MNAKLQAGLLAALLWGGAAAAMQPGDTRMSVVAELGAPTGFIRAGKEETLYYDRGHIQLQNGKVVDFELISPEQLRAKQAAAEKARVEQAARMAEQRAQLKAEGETALKRLRADPDFAQASAGAQVARWREFMKKYPDVAVAEYYLPALKRFEAEQARAAQEQRIATLEQRVQAAEQRVLMNDTRRMQYPDYYLVQPSIYYPRAFPLPGPPHHTQPQGPSREAVSGMLPRMYMPGN